MLAARLIRALGASLLPKGDSIMQKLRLIIVTLEIILAFLTVGSVLWFIFKRIGRGRR